MITCRTHRLVAITWLAVGLASSAVATAAADAPAKPVRSRGASAFASKAGPDSTALFAGAAERLKSGDPEEVRAALLELKEAGKRAMVQAPAVGELLRRGTTPPLTGLALTVLATSGTAAQAGVVAPYVHHRTADLRSKAVLAVAACGGDKAIPVLRQALADVDPAVRGHAASALGALHGHDALADLYAALDRNVLEAAAAIGEVCVGEECAAFAAKTGRLGLDVMISGFDAILFRPNSEVADEQKVKIVEKVRDLRTLEANKYLRDLQSRLTSAPARVKQAVDEAVLATAGASS